MTLVHLVFELSEGDDGSYTLDAMASTRPEARAQVTAEVEAVLGWARTAFAGREGPLDDGHAWDHDLLVQAEAGGWTTVTLSLSARAEFLEAFITRWGDVSDATA